MKDRVSFEGIGEVMATFYAGEGVKGGQVVKLGGDGEAIPCGAGERFLSWRLTVFTRKTAFFTAAMTASTSSRVFRSFFFPFSP